MYLWKYSRSLIAAIAVYRVAGFHEPFFEKSEFIVNDTVYFSKTWRIKTLR